MALHSQMLRNDPRLQSCLTQDASHIVEGAQGSHVGIIQDTLFILDGLGVSQDELLARRYGPSTAAAVLNFKTRRKIINFAYQTHADNIVGKMTIAVMDQELIRKESQPAGTLHFCGNDPQVSKELSVGGPRTNLLGLVSSSTGSAISASPSASPATVAKARAAGAATMVTRTQGRLAAMIQMHKHPVLPQNPGLLATFDVLWRNFGMPVFPRNSPFDAPALGTVKSLDDYLSVVSRVIDGIAANLGNAPTLFRDVPSAQFEEAHAFTLSGVRHPSDPPATSFPDGIYFNPRYLKNGSADVGPIKQTEVAIHECGHFVSNETIADQATETLSSAYGYSNFVLFCSIGRESVADNE